MASQSPNPRPTYEDLAGMIGHSLVRPDLTDEQVVAGIELAKARRVGFVSVRPCDVELAMRTIGGSGVRVGSVCGFPHGSANTATKLYEARDLLRRGAREIDVVVTVSKLLAREFQHVQTELLQMAESCHKEGGRLTITLENGYLTDELKIIACVCAERAEADFVKTSTGFGPGHWTAADIRLMRKHLPEEIGVEAEGVDTLEQALEVRDLGCTRIRTEATSAILDGLGARREITPT
jgi:deoxyribose-phosphate aldolase